ncbi:MAG: hypothetical protein WC799_07635 [Desulfobacteraceae bacterium]|jgi:hypothetical protein
MKITKKKTLIFILLIIFVTLLAAYFLLPTAHREVGMKTINEDKAPPLPSEDMDMVYLYTDNQGMARFSDQPPVGHDYQVVYIPKTTAVEKHDQLRLDIAEKAKKIMRGEKVHDKTVKKPINTGREFHQLPRTKAGDILSKSNELKQNAEKQDNNSR